MISDASFLMRHICCIWSRGFCLEGIVSRLRLIQRREAAPRIVLLSAVIAHYNNLLRWLGVDNNSMFSDDWRPTARRVAIWQESGKLNWYVGDNPFRGVADSPQSIVGIPEDSPWPARAFMSRSTLVTFGHKQSRCIKNVAYVARQIGRGYEAPVLLLCSTKASTREVASALAELMDDIEPLS